MNVNPKLMLTASMLWVGLMLAISRGWVSAMHAAISSRTAAAGINPETYGGFVSSDPGSANGPDFGPGSPGSPRYTPPGWTGLPAGVAGPPAPPDGRTVPAGYTGLPPGVYGPPQPSAPVPAWLRFGGVRI